MLILFLEFSDNKAFKNIFVKIDWNTNITVPTNKGRLASRLTFSSVRTVLPSLV